MAGTHAVLSYPIRLENAQDPFPVLATLDNEEWDFFVVIADPPAL